MLAHAMRTGGFDSHLSSSPVRSSERLEVVRLSGGGHGDRDQPQFRPVSWSHVVLYATERAVVARGGRSIEMRAGECRIVRNTGQLNALNGRHQLLAMYLPASAVGPYRAIFDAAENLAHSTATGSPRMIAHLLECVAEPVDGTMGRNEVRLTHHVVGLLAIMCQEAMYDGGYELLDRCKDYIETHLADPDLSPEMIASAMCISPRGLHRLFEGETLAVSALIRTRRLDQCRIDLGDVTLRALSISQIHQRWGLFDSAHFSRMFKTTYGVSPRSFRAGADPAIRKAGALHEVRV